MVVGRLEAGKTPNFKGRGQRRFRGHHVVTTLKRDGVGFQRYWKYAIYFNQFDGGRTRARTLDPLIKRNRVSPRASNLSRDSLVAKRSNVFRSKDLAGAQFSTTLACLLRLFVATALRHGRIPLIENELTY